ncbi:hypothetical protein [Dyadobacter crusticola]|uniref:hypothetical protein n=1 Tax=Dyadobacter crusticola TaxID=292407 RepID=UPI0012FB5B99|nr:hypothetical protein [Dyadobacter crusticola]
MKSLRKLHFKAMLAVTCLSCLMTSCFLKQDRTTVVYGKIKDGRGQAVDSILVICQGLRNLTYETITSKYSDESGEYEIAVEVPSKFTAANVTAPFLSLENPKYLRLFKDKISSKNGKSTGNCCIAQIGEKTRYDFELVPK